MKIRDGSGMRTVRPRYERGDRVFPVENSVCVLDPTEAQRINSATFEGIEIPDRLIDMLRGRRSEPVLWKELRTAWTAQLRELGKPSEVAALEARMASLLEARSGRPVDLSWAIQEAFSQALIPVVVAGLTPKETRILRTEQHTHLLRLMRTVEREDSRWDNLWMGLAEIRAGRVARRVLRERRKGRRPRELDLADPLVDRLPELGMDRASFAVTTVLTAIAGPPGAVAMCLVLELVRRPEWAERIGEELAALPRERFLEAPMRSAPVTYRFVREVLRFWSSPLFLTREVRSKIRVGDETLEPGDDFNLSPYLIHHDPQLWTDPDVFDPDRWLPGHERAPAHPCAYAPFGWAPTSCIGAGLGTIELMLLASLFTTRYRAEVDDPEALEVVLAAVPLPIGFRGTIRMR